jgi:hypothetical protein
MRKPYVSYMEIAPLMREYILTVADKRDIMEVTLEDINSYLAGLHTFYKTQKEEYSEGWID